MGEEASWWTRVRAGVKAVLIVVVVLGLWYLFATMTDAVVTCLPGGHPCRAPAWPPFKGESASSGGRFSRTDLAVMLLGLLMALLVARRFFRQDVNPE
jgi:hypothetical protein